MLEKNNQHLLEGLADDYSDFLETLEYIREIEMLPASEKKQILVEHNIELSKKKILKCYAKHENIRKVINKLTHKFSQEIEAWQEDEEAFYGPELFSLYIRQTILEEVNPFETMPKVAKLIDRAAQLPEADDIDTKEDFEPIFKIVKKAIKLGKLYERQTTTELFELFDFEFGLYMSSYMLHLYDFDWTEEEIHRLIKLVKKFEKQFPLDPLIGEWKLDIMELFDTIGLKQEYVDFIDEAYAKHQIENGELANVLMNIALYHEDILLAQKIDESLLMPHDAIDKEDEEAKLALAKLEWLQSGRPGQEFEYAQSLQDAADEEDEESIDILEESFPF